jgi:hypothetical protein
MKQHQGIVWCVDCLFARAPGKLCAKYVIVSIFDLLILFSRFCTGYAIIPLL